MKKTYIIRDPENYEKKMSTGRPRTVSSWSEQGIIRLASNSTLTVDTAIRNVRNIIAQITEKTTSHRKAQTGQNGFCRKSLALEKKWRRVIFTDEDKFNLDGPDGFSYYSHDLRNEERVLDNSGFK